MKARKPHTQNPARDVLAERVHSDRGVHYASAAIQILKGVNNA